VLLLIYQVPALAFLLVAAATLVLPAAHLMLVLLRVLVGREAHFNWWVVGRALPFVVAIIVGIPLILVAQQWTREEQRALAELALIYLSAAMIFLPIALPLIQAYVQRLPRAGTLLYSVLAILALPVAAALATQAAVWTTGAIGQTGAGEVQAFALASQISSCQLTVFRIVPEGMIMALPSAEAGFAASYPAYFFFWADMTFKALFLDFFEVFDCGITTVRHNPDHVLMSSFVFIYRSFVSIIVLAVVALPFARSHD
jgi:hypothetical protein